MRQLGVKDLEKVSLASLCGSGKNPKPKKYMLLYLKNKKNLSDYLINSVLNALEKREMENWFSDWLHVVTPALWEYLALNKIACDLIG